jgi:tetratricopeptide (TPR) repeat protein
VKIDADRPNAYLWRAEAELKLAEYEDAVRSFDQYLNKGGRQFLFEVYRGRGFAWAHCEKYPQAVHDYTRALQLRRDDFVCAARGWAYLALESYKLALPDFEEAIQRNRENGDFYRGRGHALVKLGRYRQAVDDVEESLRCGPKTSTLLHDAARVYAQAVAKVQADLRLTNRQSVARNYQERAVQLIRASVELLPAKERRPFWRDKVLPDSALSPVHGSTEFLRLGAEYSQSAK